jgi:hypothetical protein
MPPSQRAGRACAAIGRGTMLLAMAGTTTASSVKRWRDAGGAMSTLRDLLSISANDPLERHMAAQFPVLSLDSM